MVTVYNIPVPKKFWERYNTASISPYQHDGVVWKLIIQIIWN